MSGATVGSPAELGREDADGPLIKTPRITGVKAVWELRGRLEISVRYLTTERLHLSRDRTPTPPRHC